MQSRYMVDLWEDTIEYTDNGSLKHHPLNSRYYQIAEKDGPSYGHLTFGGHDLNLSNILSDIHVFYLEFSGEAQDQRDREAWADPLRIDVLKNLSGNNHVWYLSMVGDMPDTTNPSNFRPIDSAIQDELLKLDGICHSVTVQSEIRQIYGPGSIERTFFEVPNHLLSNIVSHYWPMTTPGYPIEGYCLSPGQISTFSNWDRHAHDDRLFREVMDKTWVSFYTIPSERRHFVFLTNRMTMEEFENRVDIISLRSKAAAIDV